MSKIVQHRHDSILELVEGQWERTNHLDRLAGFGLNGSERQSTNDEPREHSRPPTSDSWRPSDEISLPVISSCQPHSERPMDRSVPRAKRPSKKQRHH